MGAEKGTKLDKNYDTVSKYIRNLVKEMGLSSDLIDRAQAKSVSILRLKEKGKESVAEQKDREKQKEKNKDRITIGNRQIAGYCLWAACYDNDLKFKDVRIANELGITKNKWDNIVKEL